MAASESTQQAEGKENQSNTVQGHVFVCGGEEGCTRGCMCVCVCVCAHARACACVNGISVIVSMHPYTHLYTHPYMRAHMGAHVGACVS